MPCGPALSATMKAWSANTFTSRHMLETAPSVRGRSPRNTGFAGSEMSTKAVPSFRPKMTYSRPVSESVQPQRSLAMTPRPPPIASTGR